jgi:polysaccharide biosynthesis protein VpsQ
LKAFFTLCTLVFTGFALWLIFEKDMGVSNAIIDYVAAWPNGDKVGHFLLFGTVSFCAVIASDFKIINISRYLVIYKASLFVAVIVIIEECSQIWLITRTFELADLLANILGILVFSSLAYAIGKRYKITDSNSNLDTERNA